MPLPTFNLQTRTGQKKVLAQHASWANYVWLIGIEVMAKEFYPTARTGDKLYAVGLCPYPFVPYFPVASADPVSDLWLSMFISLQVGQSPEQTPHPILCEKHILDGIRGEYIAYEWPRQLGDIYQDIVCVSCGMVQQVDGVDLAFGVDTCNQELCMEANCGRP